MKKPDILHVYTQCSMYSVHGALWPQQNSKAFISSNLFGLHFKITLNFHFFSVTKKKRRRTSRSRKKTLLHIQLLLLRQRYTDTYISFTLFCSYTCLTFHIKKKQHRTGHHNRLLPHFSNDSDSCSFVLSHTQFTQPIHFNCECIIVQKGC